MDAGNVGVVQRGERLRLALEAREPIAFEQFLSQELDGDVATEASVADW